MRRLISYNNVTADGYFAASDGNLNWVVPDEEIMRANAEHMEGTGAMIFGRRTYQMFEQFWPNALDDSKTSPDPHAPGQRSETLHDIATWINNAEKIVFSKTLKNVTWKNSRLIRELDPAEVETIKRGQGKDIMIFGSGSIVSQLTEHGLIDEYQFVVNPLLLGAGQSLVRGVPRASKLKLMECKAYGSGNVLLRYAQST